MCWSLVADILEEFAPHFQGGTLGLTWRYRQQASPKVVK